MIGGQGTVRRGEPGAVSVRELVGVQLEGEAVALGGGEHPRRLLGAECDAFAEGVHGVGEPVPGDGGQRLAADEVDVRIGPVAILRRQGMGAEKGGPHGHRVARRERPRRAQHLGLGLDVETVPRLDLDTRDALLEQRAQACPRAQHELALGRRARGRDRGDDAAAAARDFLVADAAQALFELVRATAAVDEVGVAVDEPRRHEAATAVMDARRCVDVGGRCRPNMSDATVFDHDGGVGYKAVGLARRRHGGDVGVQPDGAAAALWCLVCVIHSRRGEASPERGKCNVQRRRGA